MSHGRGWLAECARAVVEAGACVALACSCTAYVAAQEESLPAASLDADGEVQWIQAIPSVEFPQAGPERSALDAPASDPDIQLIQAPSTEFPGVEDDEPAAAPASGDSGPKPFWTTVPPLSPLPRTGNFVIFPGGPGYYSLKDRLTGEFRQAPPKAPWPLVSPHIFPFYDADFRYLDDPKNTQHDWLDPLKRIHIGDNWLLSLGGEVRYQYKNEYDSRLTGINNSYSLVRTRLYGDLWYRDRFRIFAEFLDGQSSPQSLPPLLIDRNFGDFLNLFVDLKLFDIKDNGLYVRAGRQELYYGSQRLISPLDWANTRRTFEGVKAFWHSEKWDVDAFFVKPVLIQPRRFDFADATRPFAGLWTTYRPKKGQAIDFYYLYLEEHRKIPGPRVVGARGGQNVNTLGSRYVGDKDGSYLWDFEGAYQFGTTVADQTINAGMATAGLGYRFKDAPMTPTFWIYNDYASGDDAGAQGGTFNPLFPFGHFYLGFLDVPGRQNIEDLNLHLYAFPTKWIFAGLQTHFFYLASKRDPLFGTGGAPLRRSATGAAGYNVGQEVDLILNFHLTQHQDILLGYSKLWAGEFLRNTPPNSKSPDLFYLQYTYRW